jgi:hypothetical protein
MQAFRLPSSFGLVHAASLLLSDCHPSLAICSLLLGASLLLFSVTALTYHILLLPCV